MGDSTHTSPKRKRDRIPPTPPTSSPLNSPPLKSSPQEASGQTSLIRLSTGTPGAVVSEEDESQGSPRTKVAYDFQGLQLEGGPVVSEFDLSKGYEMEDRMDSQRDEDGVRKRMKILKGEEREREIPETPRAFTISIGRERTIDPTIQEKACQVVFHNDLDPVIFKGSVNRVKGAALQRAYPSINRLSDSKSRPKKRAGTPPLFGPADASLESEASTFVDPDRAALTWHDDEITGHDPSDPEDDGEGINGIGFKPTPAIAYARTAKRRQQMEEYKAREAREARAKRSERRRASELSKSSSREEAETARRVRFLEAEANSMISTL